MLRPARRSLLAGVLCLAAVSACSAEAERAPVAAGATATVTTGTGAVATQPADTRPQLPGGGRSVFPEHVVVAHYGTAGTDALGVLGGGTPVQAAERLVRAAEPFAELTGRPVLPVMELVATVAQQVPGPDGDYSQPLRADEIQPYLDAARAVGALLVLDLQPGRADLLAQAKLFEDFLREPDVGLAVDPEWKLGPEQLPGDQVGAVTVEEVDRLSRWLADLRKAEQLPEKLLLVRAFRPEMVTGLPRMAARDGLATVLQVGGFGTPAVKTDVYAELSVKQGPVVNGFTLLYGEDVGLMTPAQVMALAPRPEYVTYQ